MKTDTRVLFSCHQTWAIYKESKEIILSLEQCKLLRVFDAVSLQCLWLVVKETISSQIKEEHELEEHTAFQLHKAVVRHGFRKIRLHRTLNEEQVVVLEIAECTEMEIQQNRHDFTVGQRCCTPSTLHSAIVFQQISCIFCIKMFTKLVYNTK